MRAVWFDRFTERPVLRDVPDPVPTPRGVVVRVEATGLCRSDVHGWLGHDDGIALPHVPGHELVGTITTVGQEVRRFGPGDRVTTPFICACGHCPECAAGNGQVCRNQTQPGFTHWGSFAEQVALHDADTNLIAVPASLDAGAAALLGCRFATSYRGLVHQARLEAGQSLAVVGCGGVGLSAVMIGVALGAQVIAVDVDDAALERARRFGAVHTVNSAGLSVEEAVHAVRDAVPSGIDVSVDALGREQTAALGILSLRPRGRHVQIGLFPADPVVPMGAVISGELTVLGSHGMPARDYPGLLDLIGEGRLRPQDLIERTIPLSAVPDALVAMAGDRSVGGVTVVDPRL
ncbi:zinc-dependent alcohol dehydrogenase family protein [Arthrobacter echini]|uniref:Zinc-dependent alcohol dehydrogenase family protein n=1 Tax=Arthrobacter echini TaxID=1529066 RepID=A0A5D0XRM1_9MICC|nr:zinc-dependent alcohol dehydrogenase family protein [Arthrobacter echini]TYC98481.1 zinc-dependent alcohol dehydrogenase family protein [Arthrobacter echini]